MSKCLYCYKELVDGEVDFHKGCAKKFFGMQNAPELPYSLNDLDTLAAQVIKPQTQTYKNLPENEDLTMHLAEIAKIKVVLAKMTCLFTSSLSEIIGKVFNS